MTRSTVLVALIIGLAVLFVVVVRLRPGWLPRGMVNWDKKCPSCGSFSLQEMAAWSWTVSETGELFLLSWGAAREPGDAARQSMKDRWPAESSEKYEQCSKCRNRFVRIESHPMAGEPAVRVEACPPERWDAAVRAS